MSFAKPLIEDLRKKRVSVRSCGYFSRVNFPENFIVRTLQSNDKYDLNIRFGKGYPISKAEFECKAVEVEVGQGIPRIFNHDCDVAISENLKVLVRYFERVKREEMESFRDYLKSLGYKSVKFRRG
ncbi:MAG: hypothetical protein ACP5O8_01195 [Candidatus Aenigmatarchaeota archaeon]